MPYSPIRRFPRYAVDLAVIRTGRRPGLERVEDLSAGGARVLSPIGLCAGTQHTFLFVLPGEGEPSVVPVHVQIAWAHAGKLGLCFREADARIGAYLEAVAQARPPALLATSRG